MTIQGWARACKTLLTAQFFYGGKKQLIFYHSIQNVNSRTHYFKWYGSCCLIHTSEHGIHNHNFESPCIWMATILQLMQKRENQILHNLWNIINGNHFYLNTWRNSADVGQIFFNLIVDLTHVTDEGTPFDDRLTMDALAGCPTKFSFNLIGVMVNTVMPEINERFDQEPFIWI